MLSLLKQSNILDDLKNKEGLSMFYSIKGEYFKDNISGKYGYIIFKTYEYSNVSMETKEIKKVDCKFNSEEEVIKELGISFSEEIRKPENFNN